MAKVMNSKSEEEGRTEEFGIEGGGEATSLLTEPTGHEQKAAVITSMFFLMLFVVGFGVIYRRAASDNLAFDHWSWYLITGLQTFFAFVLPIAYPGYAVFAYTAGLGNNGPATRLEAFYINSTMGMVLGIPMMAMVDHFMFVFAPCVMLLGWMPWAEVQLVASGLGCLCGLYMALWIPTNWATGTKDPGPFILCAVFAACSFFRAFSVDIGFQGSCQAILVSFNASVCACVLLLSINGVRRAGRAVHTIALTRRMCSDIGDGPVWQAWPKDKQFPSGWWFEPPPFGSNTGWPYSEWPSGPNSAKPPHEMITAASEEMQRELPHFFPLSFILGGMFTLVLGLIVAAIIVGVRGDTCS